MTSPSSNALQKRDPISVAKIKAPNTVHDTGKEKHAQPTKKDNKKTAPSKEKTKDNTKNSITKVSDLKDIHLDGEESETVPI